MCCFSAQHVGAEEEQANAARQEAVTGRRAGQGWTLGQFDVEAALRRHMARWTHGYNPKLTHYPWVGLFGSCLRCAPCLTMAEQVPSPFEIVLAFTLSGSGSEGVRRKQEVAGSVCPYCSDSQWNNVGNLSKD